MNPNTHQWYFSHENDGWQGGPADELLLSSGTVPMRMMVGGGDPQMNPNIHQWYCSHE
jgi:hypothetical protein